MFLPQCGSISKEVDTQNKIFTQIALPKANLNDQATILQNYLINKNTHITLTENQISTKRMKSFCPLSA